MRIRLMIGGMAFLLAGIAAASTGEPSDSLALTLTLFLHQVLFVFWLGPDIGVYMWGTKLANSELSQAQRAAAGRIMRSIEIIPRACMSLMLTVGGVLSELMGITHPAWQMVGIWGLGPVWLTLTLLVHFKATSNPDDPLRKLDGLFRWLVVATVLGSVGFSLATGRLESVPWLTAKLLLFAAVVYFGIMMRRRLSPVQDAVVALEKGEGDSALDTEVQHSLSRARIFMFASWLALAAAAFLGVVQPGS